jgi:hypothetical protein
VYNFGGLSFLLSLFFRSPGAVTFLLNLAFYRDKDGFDLSEARKVRLIMAIAS